jgi:hypothetical protein
VAVHHKAAIRSLLSFELVTSHAALVLSLSAEKPSTFTVDSAHLGQIFAIEIAVTLAAGRRETESKNRRADRDILGQAKRHLMERFSIYSLAAFNVLAQMARRALKDQAVLDICIVPSAYLTRAIAGGWGI